MLVLDAVVVLGQGCQRCVAPLRFPNVRMDFAKLAQVGKSRGRCGRIGFLRTGDVELEGRMRHIVIRPDTRQVHQISLLLEDVEERGRSLSNVLHGRCGTKLKCSENMVATW